MTATATRIARRAPILTAALLGGLLAGLAAPWPAAAQGQGQPRPQVQGQVPEEIGSWRLSCLTDRITDRAECLLRHREPVERAQTPGGTSLILEIQERDGRMVPVVTARDLTLEAAARGLLAVTGTAQLRFPPHPHFEMPCGLEGRSLVCAPKPEDLARAAEELASADEALVRVTGLGSGQGEPTELDLERTRQAIAQYRNHIPAGSAPAAPASGLTLNDIIGRLQGLFGR